LTQITAHGCKIGSARLPKHETGVPDETGASAPSTRTPRPSWACCWNPWPGTTAPRPARPPPWLRPWPSCLTFCRGRTRSSPPISPPPTPQRFRTRDSVRSVAGRLDQGQSGGSVGSSVPGEGGARFDLLSLKVSDWRARWMRSGPASVRHAPPGRAVDRLPGTPRRRWPGRSSTAGCDRLPGRRADEVL